MAPQEALTPSSPSEKTGNPSERQRWIQLREEGWRSGLAAFTNGLLAFLIGSGLEIGRAHV